MSIAAVRWVELEDVNHLVSWEETRRVIREAARQRRTHRRERTEGDRARLKPRPDYTRLMRSPLGRMIARPWLDDVSIQLLADWVFPMSRAWAAATVAGGGSRPSAGRCRSYPDSVSPSIWLTANLKEIDQAVPRMQEADAAWEEALFGTGGVSSADAVGGGRGPAGRGQRFGDDQAAHGVLRPWAQALGLPLGSLPTPQEVEDRHGARLADPGPRLPHAGHRAAHRPKAG